MANFRQTGDAFYFFFMQVIVNIGKQLIITTVCPKEITIFKGTV